MRDHGVLPASRRPEAGRHHDRPDRAPRPGCGWHLEPRGRPGGHAPRPSGGFRSSTCPTAANQPMSKDGLTLVYNGELYNFRELRADLKARGVRFGTAIRHRGGARGLARLGAGGLAALPRHVRVRAGRRDDRRSRPGPRPARHQAAVLPAARRRPGLRLGAEGAYGRGRSRAADRAGRHGGVDALLLGARSAVRHRRRAEAPARLVGAASAPTARLSVQQYWRIADVAAEAAGSSAARTWAR